MLAVLILALAAFDAGAQSAKCKPGVVLEVAHGRDYTLTVCDVGVVALRGVEAPLRIALGLAPIVRGPAGSPIQTFDAPVSGVLGGKNIGPEAVAYLSKLVGQRVTLVNDGYRIGDSVGRQYAYVFLSDKTLLNAEMIRRGLGYADRQGSHPRRDEFIALEAMARRSKAGVWEDPTPTGAP
jgi:Staphylococcal nuclease homologue